MTSTYFTNESEAHAYCAARRAAGFRAYVLSMREDFHEVRSF